MEKTKAKKFSFSYGTSEVMTLHSDENTKWTIIDQGWMPKAKLDWEFQTWDLFR